MTEKMPVVQMDIKDCPISSVQVYLDRAEITRSIKLADLPDIEEEAEYSIDVTGMVVKAEPEVSNM